VRGGDCVQIRKTKKGEIGGERGKRFSPSDPPPAANMRYHSSRRAELLVCVLMKRTHRDKPAYKKETRKKEDNGKREEVRNNTGCVQ